MLPPTSYFTDFAKHATCCCRLWASPSYWLARPIRSGDAIGVRTASAQVNRQQSDRTDRRETIETEGSSNLEVGNVKRPPIGSPGPGRGFTDSSSGGGGHGRCLLFFPALLQRMTDERSTSSHNSGQSNAGHKIFQKKEQSQERNKMCRFESSTIEAHANPT